MGTIIRALSERDKDRWLALWEGYLDFYNHELTSEQTELTWQRLLHSNADLYARVIEVDGVLAGFAHYFWTPSTWQENKDLYLEDLFVAKEHRGKKLATALIQDLIEICRHSGGSKVHWQTHQSNAAAIALYERLGKQSEFIVFEALSR